ncbi:MAG: hypothetical protein M3442_17265 [Chloroflexota bacterium]|nr:hypothetical protein [Chloroflexota bacterium]
MKVLTERDRLVPRDAVAPLAQRHHRARRHPPAVHRLGQGEERPAVVLAAVPGRSKVAAQVYWPRVGFWSGAIWGANAQAQGRERVRRRRL